MSSPWTVVSNIVKLNDETNWSVRVGPAPIPASPPSKLEVVGRALVTLQDKGGNVFDVKAYGALGDGATDDVLSINNALTALTAAGGGTLYFPPGKYLVTSEVAITGNVPILVRGAGPAASAILIRNPNPLLPSTHNAFKFRWTGATGANRELFMEVRDLRFEPPTTIAAAAGGAAIRQECDPQFQNTFVVRNCWFREVFNCVHLTQTGSSTISGCQFVDPKNAAIFLEQNYPGGGAPPGDVGITFISECYFFDKVPASAAPYGVLATSGASGVRLHHNYFIRFVNPIMFDLVSGAFHTAIDIDDNTLDGVSSAAKIRIKGAGQIASFHICNNQINSGTHGLVVEVSTAMANVGKLSRGVIAGNVFNGKGMGTGAKGMVFTPGPGADVSNILISDNHFNNMDTGIELSNVRCHAVSIQANAFEDTVANPPVVNLGADGRGAFFPDRVGIGKVNTLAQKDLYIYSSGPVQPRVYLEGTASSTPGIDFAFDNSDTRRVAIVGRAVGSTGAQMEFYSKPEGAAIHQRAILDPNGNMIWIGREDPPGTWVDGLYQEMAKLSGPDPGAPPANRVRFFARANPSSPSKLQFCVRFPTGGPVVLASEA